MGDQLRLNRIHRLEGLRNTAFNFGGPIGIAFTRSFELIQTVVRDTMANLENIDFVLDSLINDNAKAAERDGLNLDPQRQLIYGLAESVGVLVQSILEERGVMQQQQTLLQQQQMLQPKYDQTQDAPELAMWKEEPEDPRPDCITIDDDDDEPTTSISNTSSESAPGTVSSIPSGVLKRSINAVDANNNQTAVQKSNGTPVEKRVRIENTTPSSNRSRRGGEVRVFYDEDDNYEDSESGENDDRSAVFPCLHCDQTFKSSQARGRHTVIHDGDQCAICHKHMSKGKISKHMKDYHGQGIDESEEAASSPARATAATPATRRASPTTPAAAVAVSTPKNFDCDKCCRKFHTPRGLNLHRKVHDESMKICDFCRYFVKIEHMDAHIAEHHPGKNRDEPPLRHKCPHCEVVRSCPHQMEHHIRRCPALSPQL